MNFCNDGMKLIKKINIDREPNQMKSRVALKNVWTKRAISKTVLRSR